MFLKMIQDQNHLMPSQILKTLVSKWKITYNKITLG